ncbi:MAG: ankyrin repeat domain-containing protein [Thermoflexales bacterium]|nr:ankyrin repeat domain-containing protein [Thermoflexales bacterium]
MTSTLFDAIKKGDLAAVSAQLATDPSLANASADGMSAVTTATFYGKRAIAEALIASGATLDIFDATMTGRLERVRALLRENPTLVNAISAQGHTVFGLAAFFGQPEVAGYLLEMGADVHQRSANDMAVQPLHAAVAAGQGALARALIARGADVNARQQHGFTSLQGAAQNGDVGLIKLLLDHGADASARNDLGKTALDYARDAGHALAARALGG